MVDLPLRVRNALAQEGAPAALPPDRPVHIPRGAQMLGMLPLHLQHLYVLCEELKQDKRKEHHRRCVAILGKEEYDHEIVEYMVYQEVEADPKFDGEREVNLLLNLGVLFHFPMIAKNKFEDPIYAIVNKWQVWGVVRKGPKPAHLPPAVVIVPNT